MAKQHGLGQELLIDGYRIGADVQSFQRISGGKVPLDMTAITMYSPDRKGGVRDGAIEASSFMNGDAASAHDVLSAIPTANEIVTYCIGKDIGDPAANLVALQFNYDASRAQDGALLMSSSHGASGGTGMEWGDLLTAVPRTDGAAANGAGVDFGASSAFGLQAFLHVEAFTGTSVTVKIQESSDNAVGDPYADVVGAGFTAVSTSPIAQRLETARGLTIERWLRVVTTGVFSNAVFTVVVVKNLVAVTFSA